MLALRLAGVVPLLALLAACGGTASLDAPRVPDATGNAAVNAARSAAQDDGLAVFRFSLPGGAADGASRSPRYISLNTQSFVILTNGANPQTLNVNRSSPNCQLINNAGSLSCALSIRTGPGIWNFTVNAFALPNGAGALLSTNETGPIRILHGPNAPIAITLEGVVAAAALTLQATHPAVGTPAKIPLTVVLKDASGAIIVGSGRFNSPITLTSSNTTAGPLSKTTLAGPLDESGITANYTGAGIASIVYSATGGALVPGAVTNAVLAPARIGARTIYILTQGPIDSGIGNVLTYDAAGAPSTPTIDVHSPLGLAVDAAGKIYVAHDGTAYYDGGESTFNPNGTPSTPTIDVPFNHGITTTAVTVANGIMYLGYWNDISYVGTISRYYAASGNPTDIDIQYANNKPADIAIDLAGKLYVAEVAYLGNSSVRTYTAAGDPTSPTIDFGLGMNFPTAVAVDATGKIYVADTDNRITTYDASGAPTTPTITKGLSAPQGLAIDAAGKIYVANAVNRTITTYNPDGSASSPTIVLPAGYQPIGIAVR